MDKQVKLTYRNLCMMRDRIHGLTVREIASVWGVSVRVVSSGINRVASGCMRDAMTQTQGDPEHPATPRFTVEEFTTDPRGAMVAIMEERISKIEELYPSVKD